MVCIYCGGKLQVTNSRRQVRSNQIWRRRKCTRCLAQFTSHEIIDAASALMVQTKDQPPRSFMVDKLFTEILLSLQDRKDCYLEAREITTTILQHLLKLQTKPIFTPEEISKTAALVLKRYNRRAYLRYQAEHPSLLGTSA